MFRGGCRWGGIAGAAVLLAAAPLAAQQPAATLRVHLVTMAPGDAIWERFGHNALWIHDAETGRDLTYNYGLFSFEQPGFIRRFIMGRMLYGVGAEELDRMVPAYASRNRSVWAQELNLTAAQKLELKAFLEWNVQPGNNLYLYDYYRDNCSTRVRDALDRALGGALRTALDTVRTGETYRSHSLRFTYDDIPISTGLLLAMGPAVDRPLSAWDESFIPMQLSEHVRDVRVRDDAGDLVPLVVSELVLFTADRAASPAAPPRRLGGYLLVGLSVAIAIAALGRAAARGGAAGARAAFTTIAVVWTGLVGVFGTIIVFLWVVTDHVASYGNENVLQANPLGLALAVAIPVAMVRGGRARVVAFWIAATAAALSLLGLLLEPLPAFAQSNLEILALLVPAHLALAAVLYPWRVASLSLPEDARPA
jgi:hypothetical protein